MKNSLRIITAACIVVLSLGACDIPENLGGTKDAETTTSPASTAAESTAATSGTDGAPANADMVSEAKAKVEGIKTVPEVPKVDGYDRSCGKGHDCVFGPAWTDDQDAPKGHNGCDTRNDVIAQQVRDIKYKSGSDCVVASGTYTDPYFGTEESFVRGEPTKGQDEIDHTIALATVWRLGGGYDMPLEKRKEIANDAEYNLVLTTRAANSQGYDSNDDGVYDPALGEYPGKSDLTASEWLPYLTDTGRACDYSARYVLTADRYDLPITEADKAAIEQAFSRC